MKRVLVFAVFLLSISINSCKQETDKTSVFEGTFKAPIVYVKYDKVVVTRVDNQSFSIQYVLGSSAPFLIIPTATLDSDSTFSFDLAASVNQSIEKFSVKGNGKIFPNRILITGSAINQTNEFDFYNLTFEGYKK